MRAESGSAMKHSSVLRFSGFSSIIVGVLYICVGATHFLLPRGQLRGAEGVNSLFFKSLADNSLIFSLHYWIVVILSLLTFAVIIGLFELLRDRITGPICWAAVVGFLGAGVCAIDFAVVGVEAPRIARQFMLASPDLQTTLIMIGIPHIDPCFFSWGLMGIWALTTVLAAMSRNLISRPLGVLGLAGCTFYFLTFLGALFRVTLLIDISAALGGVVIAPIWYIWIGLILRRAGGIDMHRLEASKAP